MNTNVVQMFKVSNFRLKEHEIIAEDTDENEVVIRRVLYEHWLTNGTGKIQFNYEVPTSDGEYRTSEKNYSVDDYWQFAQNVNNTLALMDISDYLNA